MEDAVHVDKDGIKLDALAIVDNLANIREPALEPIAEFDLFYSHGLSDSP